ncbi:DUF6600 domain-containing protein [Polaromonas sp. JS666]|uniref:DUF6600 domain-containing protein n=1 Tax=Polaromonas sp. (strain JS666 / ATCC BAA-500) TaxID=296591 RepID=UPI0000464864|nr:DUF6600 domain-containing protein [Polaromonas sp. JS666]ABE46215.1 putative prolin-rich exported protein [Polaromonas sp. JS666]
MDRPSLRKLFGIFFLGLCAFALSGWAYADPPSRVARLAYVSGAVSFSPGGENDWVRATVNRPLITGDRLWADAGSRSELQLGGAAIRMGSHTSVTLLNVDDRIAQVQLTQGTLNIRIWRFDRNHAFEINTPNLAYSIRSPGSYRIHVDPNGDSTVVMVRAGQAEVYGEGRAFVIRAGQGFEFFGTGLRDYDSFALAPADDFDRWSSARDLRWENSASARYVSRDLIGYEDLDEYGTWREVAGYGHVWTPARVAVGWAPYRDGHWAWVEPWGWTWVDDAPWGFAPSHYGRWANIGGAWAWVPGPVAARPVYAPALVVFVGGSNFSISLNLGGGGAVAWFPLGPRDVYRPSYPVSREYFTSVNTSNTIINTTNITNVYNNTNVTNVVYVNQQVPGAVVAVPTTAFVQSRPVAREAVRVTQDMVATSPVMAVAPLAPVRTSVLGAAAPSAKPPEPATARPVVAKTAPPPAPPSFASRQSALAANPGKPLDAAAVSALRPAAAPPATTVTIVTPPQSAALPPPPPPTPRAPGAAAPERTRPGAAQAPMPGTPVPSVPPGAGSAERKPSAQEERSRQPGSPPRPELPRPGSPPAAAPAAPVPAAPVPDATKPAEEAKPSRPPAIGPRNVPAGPSAQEERARQPGFPQRPEVPRPGSPPAAAPAAPVPVAPVPDATKPAEEARPSRPPAIAPRNVPAPVQRPAELKPEPVPVPPAPRASGPVAAPPSQPAAVGDTPGRRQRPEVGRAADRREAASEAKRAEEQRRRAEEERGPRP